MTEFVFMTHDAFFTRHNDALRHYDAFQMTRPKMRHNDAFLWRIFYLAAYEQKYWHHVKEHIVLVLEPSKKVAWLAFVAIMSINLL